VGLKVAEDGGGGCRWACGGFEAGGLEGDVGRVAGRVEALKGGLNFCGLGEGGTRPIVRD